MELFLACDPVYACIGWFIIGIAVGMSIVLTAQHFVDR